MKKILLIVLAISTFCATLFGQLEMDSGGDVKIGTHTGDPYCKLEVYGLSKFTGGTSSNGFYIMASGSYPSLQPLSTNTGYIGKSEARLWAMYTNYMYYDVLVDISDISMKENIQPIYSPLSKLCKVRGVKYDMKPEYYDNTPPDMMEKALESGKGKYGVIAQELKDIFPDLVTYNEETELYGVEYMHFIPIMIEAIREQQAQISELQKTINESPSYKAASSTNSFMEEHLEDTKLFQNSPNPFSEETTIRFSINSNIQSAYLLVNDMTGKQLMKFDIAQMGEGEIRISGGEFGPGLYLYSLVADNLLVGTNQMIITD